MRLISLEFVVLLCVLISTACSTNSRQRTTKFHDYVRNEIFKSPMKAAQTLPLAPSANDAEDDFSNEIGVGYQKTFLDFYYEGIKAYLANDWESCIHLLERSVQQYRNYYDDLSLCRIHCEFERRRHKPHRKMDYDHRNFFEGMIVKTLCLERCRQKDLKYLPKWFVFDHAEKAAFKSRRPYEYLQLCYYKDGESEKALQATYTALVANMNNEMLRKNLDYYMGKDFDDSKLVDLEEKEFSKAYLEGITDQKLENWPDAIKKLELALDLWMKEHDKCRAFCEGGLYQNWLPDFVSAVSNHYVSTLRCKQNCTRELSYANGRYYDDLYPSMYDYLQYAYYKSGNVHAASRCAASYLLFYPHAEDMLVNVQFYKKLSENDEYRDQLGEGYLKPRDEATDFFQREIYEDELLDYVDSEFGKLLGNGIDDFR